MGNDGSHVRHARGIGAIINYSGVVVARPGPKRRSIRRIYEVCPVKCIARSKRQNIRVNDLYSSLGPTERGAVCLRVRIVSGADACTIGRRNTKTNK